MTQYKMILIVENPICCDICPYTLESICVCISGLVAYRQSVDVKTVCDSAYMYVCVWKCPGRVLQQAGSMLAGTVYVQNSFQWYNVTLP